MYTDPNQNETIASVHYLSTSVIEGLYSHVLVLLVCRRFANQLLSDVINAVACVSFVNCFSLRKAVKIMQLKCAADNTS